MINKIDRELGDNLREITFIHAADLHLDSLFKGLTHLSPSLFEEVRQSTFSAFDTLIQEAILHQVDFLLLTGDLFDHEVQSLKAQIHLRDAFIKLQQSDIQVYLSYGNHDFVHRDSQQVSFPENVYVFEDEKVRSFIYEKDEQPMVEIHGFSYEKRAVTEEKINDYPIRNQQTPFHIGMLHGALYGNSEHHAYAPFQLSQLKEKAYDYWALGHIHKRMVLSEEPSIIYPGNIQGRHRKEAGEKGCYLVTMTEQQTKTTFIALQQIQFIEIRIDLTDKQDISDVESSLYHELESCLTNDPYLIHLTWVNAIPNHFGRHTEKILYELTEVFNEQIVQETPWRYIYQTKIQFAAIEEQQVNALFLEEVAKAFEEIDVQDEISDLIQHPRARNFLELPSDAELLSDAENTLLRKLLQRSEGQP